MATASGKTGLTVGIDATNLRRGGGLTHIVEVLAAAVPQRHGVSSVVVWGGRDTLARLPDRPWLEKVAPPALDRGLLLRTVWQKVKLSQAARAASCDLLFVPGGSYYCDFVPIVTMSRNMLPFEWHELMRYGASLTTLKLILLRGTQARSYRRADGLIFLTDYARRAVGRVVGRSRAATATIPHGLDNRFVIAPRPQRRIETYTPAAPLRLLYVSIIDAYKHQWNVIEAVHALRSRGLQLQLDLVGPSYGPALARMEAVLARVDPGRHWVHYHGPVQHSALHEIYGKADLGIFASSCENMPNILLETMAAGLPIACSSRGPMSEILGDAGEYFDPEQPNEIEAALAKLIQSPELRARVAASSFERSQAYSWSLCADRTFAFLRSVAEARGKSSTISI